jgi:hypothetical protein
MGEQQVSVTKSLGQVAYEAYMEAAGDGDRVDWVREPLLYRSVWQQVVDAVLTAQAAKGGEQAAPQGPKSMFEGPGLHIMRFTKQEGEIYSAAAGAVYANVSEQDVNPALLGEIALAVGAGVVAGLRAWEQTR